MILILGGMAAGKRTYARTLGYTDADMARAVLDERPVLYDLQDMVALNPAGADALLPALSKKGAVLCCEVGSGVIPVDPAERAAREATGRLCILLAQRAERVVRIVCGIPVILKETESKL